MSTCQSHKKKHRNGYNLILARQNKLFPWGKHVLETLNELDHDQPHFIGETLEVRSIKWI